MISEEWRRKEGRTPAVVALHPPKAASDIALNKLDFSQTEGPLQEDGHGGVCVCDAAWRRAVGIQTPPERSRPSTSSPGAWGETTAYYYDDEDSVSVTQHLVRVGRDLMTLMNIHVFCSFITCIFLIG